MSEQFSQRLFYAVYYKPQLTVNECTVTVWNKLRIVYRACPPLQQTYKALFMVCGSSAIQRHSKAALLFKCQTEEKQQRENGRTATRENQHDC